MQVFHSLFKVLEQKDGIRNSVMTLNYENDLLKEVLTLKFNLSTEK